MNYLKKSAVCIAAMLLAANSFGVMPYNPIELPAITANAADVVASGDCGAEGDNVTWELDSEGTLTISGEGEMADAPDFGQHDITKVVVENGVTSIGGYAFNGRENVTSIIIPDSVVSIGAGAFEYCNLTSVTIPDSVTSIGGRAFSDTPWIAAKQKENPLVIVNGILIDGTTCEGEVVIPDSVTSIGEDAFRWHENVTSIIIPDSVTSIGDYAFSQCIGLTSITIPDSVTSIGECAFQNTPWLEEKRKENPFVIVNGILISATCEGDVVIPDSVTSIGDFAFGYCRNLTSVIIPDSVTSIGDIAFECCSNLNSITIPDSVTSIGQGAFKWCQSLVSVTLPNNITCIEDYTFSACEKLTSITIPSNVTTIGGSAFGGCNITSITLPDKVSNIGTWAFWRCEALNSITINNPECEIYDEDGTIANGYNDEVYFNGTIYGYAGSTAQAYAEKYNRKFVALDEKPTAAELGDVNGDDSVDSSDASLVLAEYARIQTGGAGEFTESQLKSADVNNDSVIDSSDASKILAYYAMISTGKEPEWD